MSREFVLKVGETADIKRSFFGTSYALIYAGMPNKTVYSVVLTNASGYHATAYNLFLSVDQTRIQLPKGSLQVRKVTPEEIRFTMVN